MSSSRRPARSQAWGPRKPTRSNAKSFGSGVVCGIPRVDDLKPALPIIRNVAIISHSLGSLSSCKIYIINLMRFLIQGLYNGSYKGLLYVI